MTTIGLVGGEKKERKGGERATTTAEHERPSLGCQSSDGTLIDMRGKREREGREMMKVVMK